MNELSESHKIPATPCIFACGRSVFRANKFYVSIDGEPRIVVIRFSQALIAMTAAYFVFNVKYADGATNTLDFIQRVILDYNPEVSTKTHKKRTRGYSGNISLQLDRLISTLRKFETDHDHNELSESDPDYPDEPLVQD